MGCEFGRFARGERAAIEFGAQGLPVEEFGDDEASPILFADIVDGKEVGMIERGDGASLLLETAEAVGVAGEGFGEHFERDLAAKAGVAGAVDFAHAAGTQRRNDLVWSQMGSRREWHGMGTNYIALYRLMRFRSYADVGRAACSGLWAHHILSKVYLYCSGRFIFKRLKSQIAMIQEIYLENL